MAKTYTITAPDGEHKVKGKAAAATVVRSYLCADCLAAAGGETSGLGSCLGTPCGEALTSSEGAEADTA